MHQMQLEMKKQHRSHLSSFILHLSSFILLTLTLPLSLWAQPHAPFADLHCHSFLKPYYSGWPDPWEFHEHQCPPESYDMVLEKAGSVPKFTQSNFESMLLGNVKVAYLSLTPLEYEMRHPKVFRDLEKLHNSYACMAGITPDWEFFLARKVDYWQELMANIQLLIQGNARPYIAGKDTLYYEVVSAAPQLTRILHQPNRLAVVLSIEGAHALGQGPLTPELLASPYYEEELLEHVDVLKGIRPMNPAGEFMPFPVCVMTLNHFMWNGLSGHAKTFGQVEGYLLDQTEGMNTGVTPLGEKVIKRLLDNDNGRRILVDVKHMGIESRQWYYQHLAERRVHGDTIPVVATHCGIAGQSWANINIARNGNDQNKDAWLPQAPIAMFDEDIQEIYATHGILGIMLDKYRCGGALGNELVDESREGSIQRRRAYIHLLVANMLEVVDVIKCKEAWDIISLGTDFDGMINAMETYDQAIKLPTLRDDLISYFEDPEDIFDLFPKRKVQRYMFGMGAEEIVNKVMGGNLIAFTEKMLGEGMDAGKAAEAKE
jgi:microsomal dipeptidase-like Zn-dependent dipeptidase